MVQSYRHFHSYHGAKPPKGGSYCSFNQPTYALVNTVPSAPPQNLSGRVVSSTVIMLTWSPPLPLEVNGAIQHYTVNVVERHTSIHWTFYVVDQTLHVGGLHPHYHYSCNVSATTVGSGPFSATLSLQTLPEGQY